MNNPFVLESKIILVTDASSGIGGFLQLIKKDEMST